MLEGLDFHRGLRNWIASFMWGGRWTLAFFDRDLGRWSWAKAHAGAAPRCPSRSSCHS